MGRVPQETLRMFPYSKKGIIHKSHDAREGCVCLTLWSRSYHLGSNFSENYAHMGGSQSWQWDHVIYGWTQSGSGNS